MKKLGAIFILLTALCGSLFGQNVRKAYVTHRQDNGILYFIVPQDVFKSKSHGVVNMDMTRLSSSDTVRISFTFLSREITPARSVSFDSNGTIRNYTPEKIYIQPSKKLGWKHRYSIDVPFEEMSAIFTDPMAPVFKVDIESAELWFESKKGTWEKYSNNISIIISIMDINN